MSVRLEKQGGVGVIVLDRPPANSYDYSFLREFASAVDDVRADEDVHAVVVASASEKFFSAGADVSAFASGTTRSRVMTALLAHESFRKMENTPIVFIAAISGHCLGGGFELALACDLRFAAEGTYQIGLPETNLGLFPGSGGTQRLPRLVGLAKGLDLILNATTRPPARAWRWGTPSSRSRRATARLWTSASRSSARPSAVCSCPRTQTRASRPSGRSARPTSEGSSRLSRT